MCVCGSARVGLAIGTFCVCLLISCFFSSSFSFFDVIANFKLENESISFHVVAHSIGLRCIYTIFHVIDTSCMKFVCCEASASRYVMQKGNQSKCDFHKKQFVDFFLLCYVAETVLFSLVPHIFRLFFRRFTLSVFGGLCVSYRFACNTRAGVSQQ